MRVRERRCARGHEDRGSALPDRHGMLRRIFLTIVREPQVAVKRNVVAMLQEFFVHRFRFGFAPGREIELRKLRMYVKSERLIVSARMKSLSASSMRFCARTFSARRTRTSPAEVRWLMRGGFFLGFVILSLQRASPPLSFAKRNLCRMLRTKRRTSRFRRSTRVSKEQANA